MRAGFAKVNINPHGQVRLFGFAGRDLERPATGVHDDIFLRACYLEQGGERALIVGLDLLFLGEAEVVQYRAALHEAQGLEPRQILLNTSHSHVGPRIGTWTWGGYTPADSAYVQQVQGALLEAAQAAREAACEVTLEAGAGRSRLPLSRRRINAAGQAEWAPAPGARICEALPCCLLRRADNRRPVCLLFSISCHPSMIGGWELSGEYPGAACRALDASLGAECSLFLQGTGGDAKPAISGSTGAWRSCTWEEVEQVGEQAAQEVKQALSTLRPVAPRLRCALSTVPWPLQAPLSAEAFRTLADDPREGEQRRLWARHNLETLERGEKLPESFPLALQGIALGEGLRLIAMQGEAVAGWGLLILKQFPRGVTFPLGYSNGQGLYLPTSDIMGEHGYEVDSYYEYWVPAPLAPGFEEPFLAAVKRFELS